MVLVALQQLSRLHTSLGKGGPRPHCWTAENLGKSKFLLGGKTGLKTLDSTVTPFLSPLPCDPLPGTPCDPLPGTAPGDPLGTRPVSGAVSPGRTPLSTSHPCPSTQHQTPQQPESLPFHPALPSVVGCSARHP